LGLRYEGYLFFQMAKSKQQKQEALKELSSVLKAKTVVFAGYDKLTVGETVSTRKAMRAAGVKLLAVKKTLLAKAAAAASFADLPALPGQVALAYLSDTHGDVLAPARETLQAGKQLEGKITILGGIFDGAVTDKERMTAIASIPSRETLLAQFVNLINSPVQRFVIALDAIAKRGAA